MKNYCDKIHYRILSSEKNTFEKMVDNVLDQLPKEESILRLIFFYAPLNNVEYVEQKKVLMKKASLYCENNLPSISYVTQPPLSGALLLEVHSYTPGEDEVIKYNILDELPYVTINSTYGRLLFAGGFQTDVINSSIQQQSNDTFIAIDNLLKKEGFPINSIVRQWNYIEQIIDYENDNQNYQSFNNAREDFYNKTTWENSYPAATGIGANLGGVLIDLDAALFTSPDFTIHPIDNKMQIAAHDYSHKVLEESEERKATPKFERAKSISIDDNTIVYVSGTAAIRGEESLRNVGLEKQLNITMENIEHLIGDAEIKMLRVYLKDASYLDESIRLLSNKYKLNIPISYLIADVCRDELIIEIEGIAIK